jgi:outer membrane protein assembly factor BamB
MNIRKSPVLLALASLSLVPFLQVHGDNWPRWRGPLGTGGSPDTGLPTEWSAASNIAWKAPLRGLGVSSPIVWGDRVFVTYQIGANPLRPGNHPTLVQNGDPVAAGEIPLGGKRIEGGSDAKISLVVGAFDRATGKSAWEYEFAAEGNLPQTHQKNNLATSSPVTDGERVYAWFGSGQIVALDMSGKPVWQRHLAQEYGGFNLSWGPSSSPLIYEDRLILICYHSSSAYLLALDKRTGKELWRTERGDGVISYTTPVVIDGPSGPELIVNNSEGVEGHDPATGERLWFFEESNRFPIPAPIEGDGVAYLSRGYRSGPYMAIRAGGRGDISKTHVPWRADTGAPYVSSLVYYQGLLYMGNGLGIVTCIDAETGERVWQERLGGVYTASPVAADGKIYLVSETGETLVVRAGRSPEVLARNGLGEQVIASPAIAGGQLFVRTSHHIFAIGPGSH